MRSLRAIAMLCCAVILAAVGCAGKGEVSGKITFNGKPVVGGTVTFVASDKIPYQGPIGEDGSYSLARIPTGEAKIGVDSPRPGQPFSAREKALQKDRVEEKIGPNIDPKKWVAIPGDFAFFDKSGLSYTVKSGRNEHNIELKSK